VHSEVSAPPVVISGIGTLSAAGLGFKALSEALQSGRDCTQQVDTPLPVSAVARVPAEILPHPDFPDDRKAWLALMALEEALEDAGLAGALVPERTAVFLGTGLSSVTPAELEADAYPHLLADGSGFDVDAMRHDLAQDRGAPRRHDPSRVTGEFARRLGATGPVATNFSACAASAQAIAEGLRTIQRGEADIAFVGGHDSMIHPLGMLSFIVLGALSPTACRPFDVHRDGFLIGEGAAVLVLERMDHARARGHSFRAKLLGAGTSADAHAVTAPHPQGAGAARAITRALKDAGLPPGVVDYVNAHATGTPVGDVAEALAVSRTIGAVPVSSVKGALGHTIAAAGAIEAAACVAGLQGGWMPGTTGFSTPDPDCPIEVLAQPRAAKLEVVVSNSFGFGGQNAALVIAHADSDHG
jgi:3-oxoacyl-[acyl-carrier-protein] synthase II